MKLYHLFRCGLLTLLMLMSLPGCARSSQEPNATDEAAEEIEDGKPARPKRYHDAPPVVSDTVRYHLPVDTRIALAGSYGELRPDHFHGGLDFKTDQSTGHPVYSFADGYVRRVAINAHGYGLVVYVEHPTLGLTSVYGHLETFSDKIWQQVRLRQTAERLNNADLTFERGLIPVTGGEVIARSGNTGSSAGPHVHFELRNITDDGNEIYYDPQMFFLRRLADTQAPRVTHVYLYPQPGEGVANRSTTRQVSTVTGVCATRGGLGGALAKPMTAWGRVGLALKAYDYMDGQGNRYGLKEVRLLMEEPATDGGKPEYRMIYHFRQDAFRYSETRYTNSLTDYAAWIGQRSMIMKSFIEPGNYLQQVDTTCGNGLVMIDEERPYRFRYELLDAHGNLTTLSFVVQGQRSDIPARHPAPHGTWRVPYGEPLLIDTLGCHFMAEVGVFYTDVDFAFSVAPKATRKRIVKQRRKNRKGRMVTVSTEVFDDVPCVSPVYTLGESGQPLHSWCALHIDVPDGVAEPSQLYLANIDAEGAIRHSTYQEATADRPACVSGLVRASGRYAVRRDSIAPAISVVKAGWERMQIALSDADSGLAHYQVLIDGQFVPFDMDHQLRFFGSPRNYGIESGREHQVVIEATDYCGNRTEREVKVFF